MNIKKKRILFVVGIMILICCVFAGSYAFWTVTKEQTDTNNLVAACLDLELIEETGTFGVNNAWPIIDEEGLELEGYSFKVKNNFSETVNYIIGIDSLSIEGADYLSYDSIKVSLDSGSPKVFGSLTDIERDNVRGSKQLEIKQIEGNTTNSHNIKLWIKNEADVSEQSKQFKGQVFITGGQEISLPSRTVLASGDISMTSEAGGYLVGGGYVDTETPVSGNNVVFTYYSDGELVISGVGKARTEDGGIYRAIAENLFSIYNYGAIDGDGKDWTTDMLGFMLINRLKDVLTIEEIREIGVASEETIAVIEKIGTEIPTIKKITIEEGITGMQELFDEFENLELIYEITLPNSITEFGYNFLGDNSDSIKIMNIPSKLSLLK